MLDSAAGNLLSIDEDCPRPTRARLPSVVGELVSDGDATWRQALLGGYGSNRTQVVVSVLRHAVLNVEAPAGVEPALGQDHPRNSALGYITFSGDCGRSVLRVG